jgi:hypothetical protein
VHTAPPPPPPLPEFATVTSFLAEAVPYRGPRAAPLLVTARRRGGYSPSKEAIPPLEDVRHLILPSRQEEYFVPFNAEAPSSSWHLAASSSIFPTAMIHGPEGDEYALSPELKLGRRFIPLFDLMRGKKEEIKGDDTVQGLAGGLNPLELTRPPGLCASSTTQLVPQLKPKRKYAEIHPDASTCIYFSKMAVQRANSERAERKRKRLENALLELNTQSSSSNSTVKTEVQNGVTKLSVSEEKAKSWVDGDLVLRASINRATKKVRRTIGYEHWLERVDFETRGIELGEIGVLVSK